MPGRELTDRVRQLLGDEAIAASPGEAPLVCPADETACALLLRTASAEGWRVFVEGGRSWCATPVGTDLRLGTANLAAVGPVEPADLVATVQPGVRLDVLRERLADDGTWLALDVPGRARTLGSMLATATAGPLRSGFGAPRDHVLGLTLVTGDGRIVRVGGRVVKNVAGYDVAKLALGTFGALGVITSVHLRLRAVPRADRTLLVGGSRDTVIETAQNVMAAGLTPAALEVLSPSAAGSDRWTLAARLLGTDAEVAADDTALRAQVSSSMASLRGDEAAAFWRDVLAGGTRGSATLRLGADPAALATALDLVALHLDERVSDWISVSATAGTVRWSGETSPTRLLGVRRAAAEREWPVTLERGPAALARAVGHFGAYREGVFHLVQALRAAFDPAGILTTPLDGAS